MLNLLPVPNPEPHLQESSNPGSVNFRSQTKFQSTSECGSSQSGVGGVHAGGESGLNPVRTLV